MWVALALLGGFVACVGPWPIDAEPYAGTAYARATFARLDALDFAAPSGPLRVGVGSAEITPPVGEPLAGYSARKPKASRDVLDRLHAKAVTFSNGHRRFTIVAGDLLLVTPELAAAIAQRSGRPREELFFTATHTHSGGGAYSDSPLYALALGAYDAAVFDRLADAFAAAIRQSHHALDAADAPPPPARMRAALLRSPALDALVVNRVDRRAPYATLGALMVRGPGGAPLVNLVTFPMHPTFLHRQDRRVSGDYPGAVQRGLRQATGADALFAIGAVGSISHAAPRTTDPAALDRAAAPIIQALLSAAADDEPWATEAALGSWIVTVDLPRVQPRVWGPLALSPVAGSLVHGRRTQVQAARIGEVVLLGLPADFSGELAGELEAAGRAAGLTVLVTSFNGDYIGYALPRRHWDSGHYEARTMSFFGPWCGEYLSGVSREILGKLARAQSGGGGRSGEEE